MPYRFYDDDIFAKQRNQQAERRRREKAKGENSILNRYVRVDVAPETIVVSCKSKELDYRNAELLNGCAEFPLTKDDDRSGYGFAMTSPLDASRYLDRATNRWLSKSQPFTLYVRLKNGQVAEAHYILTTNCLDWLFFRELYDAEEREKNESVPAVLGKLDHEVYAPSIDDVAADWVSYLSGIDIFMECQRYVMLYPSEPVSVRIGNQRVLQRVYTIKTLVGMNSDLGRLFRRSNFEYSHQNSQWQSLEPDFSKLEMLFSPIEYTPLPVLGFLPEYRARKSEAPRTIRLNPNIWRVLLGSTNIIEH